MTEPTMVQIGQYPQGSSVGLNPYGAVVEDTVESDRGVVVGNIGSQTN